MPNFHKFSEFRVELQRICIGWNSEDLNRLNHRLSSVIFFRIALTFDDVLKDDPKSVTDEVKNG